MSTQFEVGDRVRLCGAGVDIGVVERVSQPLGVRWYHVRWPDGSTDSFRGHSLTAAQVPPIAAASDTLPDHGTTNGPGTEWRRCPTCKQRVWLTKRGKLCKHFDEPASLSDPDAFAMLSGQAPADFPRCQGEVNS